MVTQQRRLQGGVVRYTRAMKEKGLALILVAIVLAASGFMLMNHRDDHVGQAHIEGDSHHERTFAWRFQTEESGDGLPPRTTVALITGDEVHNLGGYPGSCSEIAAENLLENEVSGVLCWWAGGGDEIGVFKTGETYAVRHGIQEESTAEGDGLRGNFKTIVELH